MPRTFKSTKLACSSGLNLLSATPIQKLSTDVKRVRYIRLPKFYRFYQQNYHSLTLSLSSPPHRLYEPLVYVTHLSVYECNMLRYYVALPFLVAPLDFSALNLVISFSTATSMRFCNSGLYPKINSNSMKTKNGAKSSACTRLSSKAGARFSKAPCPTNCMIHETRNTEPAIWFARVIFEDVARI